MTLDVRSLEIPEVKLITPKSFSDERGYFVESWNRKAMRAAGIDIDFVQDNQSLSARTGTVRGLHFQRPPHAQTKLVSVLSGSILDVVVDMRKGSKTFGKHVSVELSAGTGTQILVPAGFAHGFCTLTPHALVQYKVDAHYSAEADGGIFWADSALGIKWPVAEADATLSAKDAKLPRLADITSPF